ncbi:hypothetical protein ACQJ22_01060 [Pseudomonas fragariae (ex Marin et al. 2024)]|uniref:hypothetical protein n=1 Tax=Pseudomonas TaxID=286 RepID=UPI00044A99B3|nr:hypothetical protein [Pseudomonas syringae]AKF46306.1 hypothetical protein PsyrB_14115 [Pseudomonas syringae pv. syringae B301D]EXL31179.1 hypothetical protein PssB301D_02472 [Pseudomonas syringae pv. syringae str. B301D-R]
MISKTTHALAVSVLGASLLTGCSVGPKETWTNKGDGVVATRSGFVTCYEDANLIDGVRTVGFLCGSATSGFMMDGPPEVEAVVGYGRGYHVELSKTLTGMKLSFGEQTGILKCDPLKIEPGRTIPQSFCTLTLNGQKLVSAKILFDGAKMN